MNCHNKGLIVAGLVMLAAGWSGRAAAESASTLPDWIKDHLEIGTRVTYFMLDDDQRDFDGGNRFFGSINNLDVNQQYLPIKLFVAYKFNPYWGLELTAEQLEVETWTRRPDGESWTDGTINLMGPIASVFGRYPNATRFTPYAGVGVGYFFADFSEDSAWNHPYGDFFQKMEMDDTYGGVVYVGLMAQINDHWSVDLLVRYIKMSVDVTEVVRSGDSPYHESGDFKFPMSNTSLGLGVRYSF